MKRRIACTLVILLALLCGCQAPNPDNIDEEEFREELQEAMRDVVADSGEAIPVIGGEESGSTVASEVTVDFAAIPDWSGEPSVEVNGNVPFFTDDFVEVFSSGTLEFYSDLDDLGRVGECFACLGLETMPAEGEQRGEIGAIKPSGWHTVKYPDVIPDLYLYNRCHLIGWQLGAENDNELNLMTGTRYLNVTGMLPYENQVADYIHDTGNHVLYRVTPDFRGNDLVAHGLLIEAKSVEDDGCVFCVYCYNVQPHIWISYATGISSEDTFVNGEVSCPCDESCTDGCEEDCDNECSAEETDSYDSVGEYRFVLNTNTMKIHTADCGSVEDISDANIAYTDKTYEELVAEGYSPCGRCHPER